MLYKLAELWNDVKDPTPWIALGGALLSNWLSYPHGVLVGCVFLTLYVALYVNNRTH
jgi:hypothetical protein